MSEWKGTHEAWEAMCDGCAKCCQIGAGYACPSLDVRDNSCKCYSRRLTTEACLRVTPDNLLQLHGMKILPDTCAYVRWHKGELVIGSAEKAVLKPYRDAPDGLKRLYETHRRVWLKSVAAKEREGVQFSEQNLDSTQTKSSLSESEPQS